MHRAIATLNDFPFTPPPGCGFKLPETYLMWILLVVLLYPACAWYAGVKRRNKSPLAQLSIARFRLRDPLK